MVIIFVITATLDNDFDSMLAKDTLQSVQWFYIYMSFSLLHRVKKMLAFKFKWTAAL